MSIEVRVPKEIKEYKEKILFGLSLRQLLCFSLALVLCGVTYFILIYGFNLNKELVGYLVIFEAMPLLAVGFIRKNGFPFEKYFALIIRHKTGILKRPYKTQLMIDTYIENTEKRGGKYDWIFKKEAGNRAAGESGTVSFKDKKQDFKKRESEIFKVTKKRRREQSKITKRKIEKARKECGAKEQGAI